MLQTSAAAVVQPRAIDSFSGGFQFGELVEVRLERDYSSDCASPIGLVLAQNVNSPAESSSSSSSSLEQSAAADHPQPQAPSFGSILECTFERSSLGLAVAKTVREDGLSALRITKATGQAAQFGLSVGDVIVSLNGEPLPPGGLHPAAFKALIKTLGRPFRLVAGRGVSIQAPTSTYDRNDCATSAQRMVLRPQQPPQTPPKPPRREAVWACAVVSACYKDGSYGIVIQGSEELLDVQDLSVLRRPLTHRRQKEESDEGRNCSGSNNKGRMPMPPTTPLYEAAKLTPPSGMEPVPNVKAQPRKDANVPKVQDRKKVEVPAKKVSSKIERALMEERNRRRTPKLDPHPESANAKEDKANENSNVSTSIADENEASNDAGLSGSAHSIDKEAANGDTFPRPLAKTTATIAERSPSKASPRKPPTSMDLKEYLLAPLPPSSASPSSPVDVEVQAAGGPWTEAQGRTWLCRAGFAECSPLRGASQRFHPSTMAYATSINSVSRTISSSSSSFHSAAPSENHWTMSGSKPVHAAAAMGEVCALAWLLSNGVPIEDLRSTNDDLLMPAHFAASHGHLNCLKFLAKHGGEDLLRARGYKARTPYYCAAAEGHTEVLAWLHQSTSARDDLVVFDRLGELPLHAAARANHVACMQSMHRFALDLARRGWEAELMENEARLDAARAAKQLSKGGPSCLEAALNAGLAARGLSKQEAEQLTIDNSGSGLDRDSRSSSSSNGSSSEGCTNGLSKAQLKDLANPTRLVDENGWMLTIHVAAAHGCLEVVRFLVAEDAAALKKRRDKLNRSRRQDAIRARDAKGEVAESTRIDHGRGDEESQVGGADEGFVVQEEKDWVTLPEVRTKQGDWAALLAAERGHTGVLEALVEKGPERRRKEKGRRKSSSSSNTRTRYGIDEDNNQCVRLLTTSDQMPPFAYACARGHLETCQWLLLHGGIDLSPLLLSSIAARAALCEGKVVLRRTMNTLSGARGFGNLGPFNRFAAAEVQAALKAWAPQLLQNNQTFVSTFLFGLSWRPNPLDNAAATSKSSKMGVQQRPIDGSARSESTAQRLSRLIALGIDTTGLGLEGDEEKVHNGAEARAASKEASRQFEEKDQNSSFNYSLEVGDRGSTRTTVKGGGCPARGLPLLTDARDVVVCRVADFLGLPTGQGLRRLREYSELFGVSG